MKVSKKHHVRRKGTGRGRLRKNPRKRISRWKKNELFSSDKVTTIQNRSIGERIEIVDLNKITKQKSHKLGIRGFKRGFLVTVYDEKRFGNVKQDKRFTSKSQALKFARAYMKRH